MGGQRDGRERPPSAAATRWARARVMVALGLLIAVQLCAAGNSGAAKTTEHVDVQSIWKPVVAELAANARAYALVYDEPDNEVRLDRSEIGDEGLLVVHPLEVTAASAETLLELILGGVSDGEADPWFQELVRGASEIHVATGGDAGVRFARLCRAVLPPPVALRRVLHLYAAPSPSCRSHGGRASDAGEDEGGEAGGVAWDVSGEQCRGKEGLGGGSGNDSFNERAESWGGWDHVGWEVLREPRGFTHMDFAFDEPADGDALAACTSGRTLHRLAVSFRYCRVCVCVCARACVCVCV